jgi:hypothetical protein
MTVCQQARLHLRQLYCASGEGLRYECDSKIVVEVGEKDI